MLRHRRSFTCAAAVLTTALTVGLTAPVLPAGAAADATAPAASRGGVPASATAAALRARADAVPTPAPDWFGCVAEIGAECTTVDVPVDYRRPDGPTTSLAVLRVPARDPGARVGTLFVNPGGPGGSAVDFALFSGFLLPPSIVERFDIVGVDPRGVGYSDNIRCFANAFEQMRVMSAMAVFPKTAADVTAYRGAAETVGARCATNGRPLVSAMSSTVAAMDLDVVRRALGDSHLTYLGVSYGTLLGQMYAAVFPKRVRALVLDSVLDPREWVGTPATAATPMTLRIKSADGAAESLRSLLRACDRIGADRCRFRPDTGTSIAKWQTLLDELALRPVEIDGFRIDDRVVVSAVLGWLYEGQWRSTFIANELQSLWEIRFGTSDPGAVPAGATPALAARFRTATASGPRLGFLGYANGLDSFLGVICGDGRNPTSTGAWPRAVATAGRTGEWFTPVWGWESTPCATTTWTGMPAEVFRGPWNAATSGPVLFMSNRFDPATRHQAAAAMARVVPGARLVTVEAHGHATLGLSACATDAMVSVLVTGRPIPRDRVCPTHVELFPVDDWTVGDAMEAGRAGALPGAPGGGRLPATTVVDPTRFAPTQAPR